MFFLNSSTTLVWFSPLTSGNQSSVKRFAILHPTAFLSSEHCCRIPLQGHRLCILSFTSPFLAENLNCLPFPPASSLLPHQRTTNRPSVKCRPIQRLSAPKTVPSARENVQDTLESFLLIELSSSDGFGNQPDERCVTRNCLVLIIGHGLQ